jgi:hypothetical protein
METNKALGTTAGALCGRCPILTPTLTANSTSNAALAVGTAQMFAIRLTSNAKNTTTNKTLLFE